MVQRDRYGENWGLKPVIFGFAVCTYQGRGRASGNPAGVVVQYRRASSSRVRLPTSTPSPRPMKGLHDLTPLWRGGVRGYQASGIRRFAVRRPPRGRLGSVLDVGNRRHRMRGHFHRQIHISTGPQQCADNYHDPPKFSIQSSLESTERSRMRSRGPSDLRPIPEGVREPIYIRKK